jgi:tetratricopeptide (TPR) repeat protein
MSLIILEVRMNKKIVTISAIVLLVLANNIFADKPLERIANELAVAGETLFNEGKYAEAAAKFQEAVSTFKQAVEQDGIPNDNAKLEKWYFNTYQSYLQISDFNNAIKIQQRRKELTPNNWNLIKEVAIIQTKYLDDADAGIKELIEYNNDNNSFEAKKMIGNYYNKYKNDKENSLIWYDKAFQQKQDSKVLQEIATLHKELGNNSEAIKAYENYIDTNPNENKLVIVYKNLATLYDDLKNNSKSIEYFEKANKLKPDDNITLLLITKYYEMGDLASAKQRIDDLLKSKPGNEDAIYYRALIKFDQGDKAAAKTDFEKLVNNSKYGKVAKGYIESIESE